MTRGIPKKEKNYIRKATRLSYKPYKPGFIESCPVLLGSEIVVIQIDKVNKLYRVLDIKTRRLCFLLGQGKTIDECKKNARKRLIHCSASILDEVRIRK